MGSHYISAVGPGGHLSSPAAVGSRGGHVSGARGTRRRGPSVGGRGGWQVTGGPGRDHTVLMEVEVDKVHDTISYTHGLMDKQPL